MKLFVCLPCFSHGASYYLSFRPAFQHRGKRWYCYHCGSLARTAPR